MALNIIKSLLITILLILGLCGCKNSQTTAPTKVKIIPDYTIESGEEVKNIPSWIVALYSDLDESSPSCTGEVVNRNYVLTAAHCIPDPSVLPYIGYTGVSPIQKVQVKNIIAYPGLADVILLQLATPYTRTPSIDFYHGYYFDRYNNYQASTKLIIMGYGFLSDDVSNNDSILNSLQAIVKDYINYPAVQVVVKSIDGITQGGDSGGPLIYNSSFKAKSSEKIIGVLTSGKKAMSNCTVLTSEVLKWIAVNTHRVIFKYPLENTYIKLESQLLNISGWGDFPTNGTVLVYDDISDSPVAKCYSKYMTYTNKDTWSCKAKFDAGYKFQIRNNYQARVVNSSGSIVDSVNFKITDANIDLSITNPDPEMEDFTYHTPKDSTYVIIGNGTPGAKLSFKLTQIDNEPVDNLHPCINQDANLIPANGVWQCEIKSTGNANYYFLVKYTNESASLVDEGDKIYTTVANVIYAVDADNSTPSISIQSPISGSYIAESNYIIKLKLSKSSEVKRVVISFIFNGYFALRDSVEIPPDATNYNIYVGGNSIVRPSDVKITANLYIDNDYGEPLATDSSNYSIVKPIVKVTSLTNSMKVPLKTSIDISGVAYYQGYELNNKIPINSAQVRVEISDKSGNIIDFDCNGDFAVSGGFWHCPNPITFTTPMIYLVSANLYKLGDTTHILAEQYFYISAIIPVGFTNP